MFLCKQDKVLWKIGDFVYKVGLLTVRMFFLVLSSSQRSKFI